MICSPKPRNGDIFFALCAAAAAFGQLLVHRGSTTEPANQFCSDRIAEHVERSAADIHARIIKEPDGC